MPEKNSKPLIAGLLVTGCVLVLGGLVAWGAGVFDREDIPAGMNPMPARMPGGAMTLPKGHPPIGNLDAMPGAVRPDAPAGDCPVAGAAAAAPKASGDSCCPVEEKPADDSCCPAEEKPAEKKSGCSDCEGCGEKPAGADQN